MSNNFEKVYKVFKEELSLSIESLKELNFRIFTIYFHTIPKAVLLSKNMLFSY